MCEQLGIRRLADVVGISAGGATAAGMAVRHPGLVERVVLECAVAADQRRTVAERIRGFLAADR